MMSIKRDQVILTESTRNASVMKASFSDVRKMSQECFKKCRLLNGKHRVTTFSTLGQIKIFFVSGFEM
jgi:hypothetical protein